MLAKAKATSSMPQASPSYSSKHVIVLELHGDGVVDLPLSERSIGPVSLLGTPLVVGRRHQIDLHRRAIEKDCRQFLSRDHYQVSWESGIFKLEALTTNPLWLDRDGEGAVELVRGEPVVMSPGDRIAVGTGSDAAQATVEEALRRLCWYFRLATDDEGVTATPAPAPVGCGRSPSPECADSSAAGFSRSGRNTPPSPGGMGPRVSNVNPWSRSSGNNWEPMLPPAEEAVLRSQAFRDERPERPSEFFAPSPQFLSADRKESSSAVPNFGGALRAPVLLEVDEDDYKKPSGGGGVLEFTERPDEFLKSGFQY